MDFLARIWNRIVSAFASPASGKGVSGMEGEGAHDANPVQSSKGKGGGDSHTWSPHGDSHNK